MTNNYSSLSRNNAFNRQVFVANSTKMITTGNASMRLKQKTTKVRNPLFFQQKTSAVKPFPLRSSLVKMQQNLGNQAVRRFIQAKLEIGAPDDKYEQEADRVANQVMRMPEHDIQRKPT